MTERELFQEHYKTSRDYKFYVKHEMTEKQIFDFNNGKYTVECVNDDWKIWQAATRREGFKFVPVEMGYQDAEKLASKEWELTKGLFMSLNRDLSTIEVEEYRLRWHKNKVYQIMGEYKAMIGAIDDH